MVVGKCLFKWEEQMTTLRKKLTAFLFLILITTASSSVAMEKCEDWWDLLRNHYNAGNDTSAGRYARYLYRDGCLKFKPEEDSEANKMQKSSALPEISSCETLATHIVETSKGRSSVILRLDVAMEINRRICQDFVEKGALGNIVLGREEWIRSCNSMDASDGVRRPFCAGTASTSTGKMDVLFWLEKHSDGDDLIGYTKFHIL